MGFNSGFKRLNLLVLHTDISLQSISRLLQDRSGRRKHNIEARSRNHCCHQRTKSITYSVALVIQHVKPMPHIILHLWPDRLYHIFPHYLNNGTIFEKKIQHKMCVFCFSLQLLSETFFILRRFQRDIFVNMHGSSRTMPFILVRVDELELSKNTQMSNNM